MQIQDQTVKHAAFVSMHRLYRYLLNTRCESHFYKRTNFQLEVLPVVLSQHTIWKYSGVYISLSWVPLMWNAQGYVGCQAFVCPFDNVHNDVCVCVYLLEIHSTANRFIRTNDLMMCDTISRLGYYSQTIDSESNMHRCNAPGAVKIEAINQTNVVATTTKHKMKNYKHDWKINSCSWKQSKHDG